MKFVALALAIILAAGCQARSLQADAPSQYEHIRAAVVTYLVQAKETAQRAINNLDDKEFKEYKDRLTKSLDGIEEAIQSASTSLAPVRQNFGPQIVSAISQAREKLSHDLEELRKELEPKREELRQVIKKHIEEYSEKLEPLVKEYSEKHQQQMEELKTKLEPVIQDLQPRIKVNVEETKSKLTPIVDTIRSKLTMRLEELKAKYQATVNEYRDWIEAAIADTRTKVESGEMKKKLDGLAAELKPQLDKMVDTIQKAFAP